MKALKDQLSNLVEFLNCGTQLTSIQFRFNGIETRCIGMFEFSIDGHLLIGEAEPISYIEGDKITVDLSRIEKIQLNENFNTCLLQTHETTIVFSQ